MVTIMMKVQDAIKIVLKLMNSIDFKESNIYKKTYFSRKSQKLQFCDAIKLILSLPKASLAMELRYFVKNFLNGVESIAPQSVFEARFKLKPEAFIELNEAVIKSYYENEYKTIEGYRVIAVDGSAFQVPNNAYSYYGGQKSQGEPQAMAQVCMLYDVLNEMIIKADIDKYIANEREQALKMIKQLDNQEQNDIFVFDRGFPSRKLLSEIGTKSKFLFRVSKQFLSAINNATEVDQIVQISDENGEAMQLRVINIFLSTGETEKLLTNIFDFSPAFFEKIYALRWGIECNYKSLKSILQIENFTSGYPVLIKQDFYATVLIANFLSISINETNQELSKKLKDKDYKNQRKINYKAAFSILKPIFMQALCESNPEIAAALLEEAQLEILNFTSVVRPNRSFQRKKKHSAAKFNFSTK